MPSTRQIPVCIYRNSDAVDAAVNGSEMISLNPGESSERGFPPFPSPCESIDRVTSVGPLTERGFTYVRSVRELGAGDGPLPFFDSSDLAPLQIMVSPPEEDHAQSDTALACRPDGMSLCDRRLRAKAWCATTNRLALTGWSARWPLLMSQATYPA